MVLSSVDIRDDAIGHHLLVLVPVFAIPESVDGDQLDEWKRRGVCL